MDEVVDVGGDPQRVRLLGTDLVASSGTGLAADSLFDHSEDIEFILDGIPEERQVALFSATIPKRIADLAGKYLRDPLQVTIPQETRTAPKTREVRYQTPYRNKLDVLTGILGGYTTFSSFSLQTLNLLRDGQWGAAGANIVGSVALCLVAVWLGHILAASNGRVGEKYVLGNDNLTLRRIFTMLADGTQVRQITTQASIGEL